MFRLDVSFALGGDPIQAIYLLTRHMSDLVVVDGGAYIGSFSKSLQTYRADAIFHLFEPTPSSFSNLIKSFRSRANFFLVPSALGASRHVSLLNINRSPLTNSLKQSKKEFCGSSPELYFTKHVLKVDVIALDDYFRENQLAFPDIIKLDLQGGELEALKGAVNCVHHASIALCEVQFISHYEGSATFDQLHSFFVNAGFQLFGLYDCSRDRASGRLLYCDVLYVKKFLLDE